MEEYQANLFLEGIIRQGFFKNPNNAFVGVFEQDGSPGTFEIQRGVYDLQKVKSEKSPFVDIEVKTQYAIETFLLENILIKEIAIGSAPSVIITDTPRFNALASKPSAMSFAAIGNYYIDDYIGTLGGFFKQTHSQDIFFLSNWHVLVDESVTLGSPIIQPNDVNRLLMRDEIGKLYGYYLDEYLDVAIGVLNANTTTYNQQKNHIIKGFDTPKWGMKLIKQGASTGGDPKTGAKVLSVNCSVRVFHYSYPNGEMVFHNQIMTGDMTAKGDSGSISIDKSSGKAVGLVFADNGHKYTLHNPLWKILNNKRSAFVIPDGVDKGKTMPEFNFKEFI